MVAVILMNIRVVTEILPFVLSASVKVFATCSTACVVSGLSPPLLHIVFVLLVILHRLRLAARRTRGSRLAARGTVSPTVAHRCLAPRRSERG